MRRFVLSWFRVPIIFIKFDPEAAALLTRLLDTFDGKTQADLDAMAETVSNLTGQLKTSQTALQSAVQNQK